MAQKELVNGILSIDIHITSPVSLSQLAAVIMHAIIPGQHKRNGSWQFEAEPFKNKIKNRALLATFDHDIHVSPYFLNGLTLISKMVPGAFELVEIRQSAEKSNL